MFDRDDAVRKTIYEVNAPIIYAFTDYVLNTAQKLKVQRIYFLSRDGYEPYIFAKAISQRRGLQTDCRYLYASRLAWRLPVYGLLPENKALDLCFFPTNYRTADAVLERIRASEAEKEVLMSDIKNIGLYEPLSKDAWESLKQFFSSEKLFFDVMKRNSCAALDNALGYFRQEGLFDAPFIICDSGWSGNMQCCLERILQAGGRSLLNAGVYFGLYEAPAFSDKTYGAYYFYPEGGMMRKLKFNNNLLECMLVSPDGLTLGYKKRGNRFYPECNDVRCRYFEQDDMYLREWLKNAAGQKVSLSVSECEQRLKQVMYKPRAHQLQCYDRYYFSDDLTDRKKCSIVRRLTKREAKSFLLFCRIARKVFKHEEDVPRVFWLYGSIAASGLKCKFVYRGNALIWEFLRLVRMKKRKQNIFGRSEL